MKKKATLENLEILAKTTKSLDHLLALEALYIREYKAELDTKDKFISRELTIKIYRKYLIYSIVAITIV